MADYITKESVHTMVRHLTKFAWRSPAWDERRVTVDTDDVHFGVDKIPSADVAPVVHGRWIQVDETKCRCSHCDIIALIALYPHGDKNFCPNCGANMDEGGNEE